MFKHSFSLLTVSQNNSNSLHRRKNCNLSYTLAYMLLRSFFIYLHKSEMSCLHSFSGPIWYILSQYELRSLEFQVVRVHQGHQLHLVFLETLVFLSLQVHLYPVHLEFLVHLALQFHLSLPVDPASHLSLQREC